MLKRRQFEQARQLTIDILANANILLTSTEKRNIEIVDFGLDELERTGLQIVVYTNNDRYCAKELVMFPRQTCPQHRHPPLSDTNPGKMETFRCRLGKVWLYVEGTPGTNLHAHIPRGSEAYYTVLHEVELNPGDQCTIPPDTWHWFQAGDQGAIVSEFSSPSFDEFDIFIDPRIKRVAGDG